MLWRFSFEGKKSNILYLTIHLATSFYCFNLFCIYLFFQHKEEDSVHGSDEEADELPDDPGSDEDLSDSDKQMQEEV